MQGQVIFSISTPENVAQIRAIKAEDPKLKVCLDLLSWWKIEGIPRFAIKALSLDQVFASEWFFPRYGFAEAKEAGAQVTAYLWGIHDLPARMERAVALGAGAVSCDRPDILLDTVRRHCAAKGKGK
jgi:glycerophosphoryl diester phosphodiesterase